MERDIENEKFIEAYFSMSATASGLINLKNL